MLSQMKYRKWELILIDVKFISIQYLKKYFSIDKWVTNIRECLICWDVWSTYVCRDRELYVVLLRCLNGRGHSATLNVLRCWGTRSCRTRQRRSAAVQRSSSLQRFFSFAQICSCCRKEFFFHLCVSRTRLNSVSFIKCFTWSGGSCVWYGVSHTPYFFDGGRNGFRQQSIKIYVVPLRRQILFEVSQLLLSRYFLSS